MYVVCIHGLWFVYCMCGVCVNDISDICVGFVLVLYVWGNIYIYSVCMWFMLVVHLCMVYMCCVHSLYFQCVCVICMVGVLSMSSLFG